MSTFCQKSRFPWCFVHSFFMVLKFYQSLLIWNFINSILYRLRIYVKAPVVFQPCFLIVCLTIFKPLAGDRSVVKNYWAEESVYFFLLRSGRLFCEKLWSDIFSYLRQGRWSWNFFLLVFTLYLMLRISEKMIYLSYGPHV